MISFLKKLFNKKEIKPSPVIEEKIPEPEPSLPEIEFDPVKHLIDPLQLKQSIEENKNLQIIDVREPHEWKLGRLNCSKHIPMNSLPLDLEKLDKNIETVMICEHGIRSLYCAYFLLQNGFTDVKSLDGGMANWYYKNGMNLIDKG